MIKDETTSLMKGINFYAKTAAVTLIVGILVFLTACIAGLSSVEIRKVLMTVSVYTLIIPVGTGSVALKLTSSLPEGESREMTHSWSWRRKPWLIIGIGFILLLISANYSL